MSWIRIRICISPYGSGSDFYYTNPDPQIRIHKSGSGSAPRIISHTLSSLFRSNSGVSLKHTNISSSGSHRVEESRSRRGSSNAVAESPGKPTTAGQTTPLLGTTPTKNGSPRSSQAGSSGIPGPRTRPPPAPPVRSNTTLHEDPPAAGRSRFETNSLDRKTEQPTTTNTGLQVSTARQVVYIQQLIYLSIS